MALANIEVAKSTSELRNLSSWRLAQSDGLQPKGINIHNTCPMFFVRFHLFTTFTPILTMPCCPEYVMIEKYFSIRCCWYLFSWFEIFHYPVCPLCFQCVPALSYQPFLARNVFSNLLRLYLCVCDCISDCNYCYVWVRVLLRVINQRQLPGVHLYW